MLQILCCKVHMIGSHSTKYEHPRLKKVMELGLCAKKTDVYLTLSVTPNIN